MHISFIAAPVVALFHIMKKDFIEPTKFFRYQWSSEEMSLAVSIAIPINSRLIRSMVMLKIEPVMLSAAAIRPPALIGAATHLTPS
jgi:hypothetical protein